MPGYDVVDVAELEGEGPGGMVRKVRRALGVDPASTRVPVSGAEGLEFVTFGAPVDGKYEPPDWG